MAISLPENFKLVNGTAGAVTTNGGITCDRVSLKTAHKAWIVCSFDQAAAHATTVQPMMATTVAGAGTTAITYSARWWLNDDMAATDTLVAQTAGTIGTLAADIKTKMLVFEIDPTALGAYDVLGLVISNSGEATNFVNVLYVLETRYPSATPPSAIVD